MNLLRKVWLDRDETSSNFIASLMSFKSFYARSAGLSRTKFYLLTLVGFHLQSKPT